MESLRVFWGELGAFRYGVILLFCIDTHLYLSRYSSVCDRVSQSKTDG